MAPTHVSLSPMTPKPRCQCSAPLVARFRLTDIAPRGFGEACLAVRTSKKLSCTAFSAPSGP